MGANPCCQTCGTLIDPTAASCRVCGTALLPATHPGYSQAPVPTYQQPQPSYQQQAPPTVYMHTTVSGGGVCPRCYAPGPYATRYTIWHFLLAICWFPLGLLIFLAPVRRCACGQDFGAGRAFVVFAQVMLGIAALLLLVLILAMTVSQHAQ